MFYWWNVSHDDTRYIPFVCYLGWHLTFILLNGDHDNKTCCFTLCHYLVSVGRHFIYSALSTVKPVFGDFWWWWCCRDVVLPVSVLKLSPPTQLNSTEAHSHLRHRWHWWNVWFTLLWNSHSTKISFKHKCIILHSDFMLVKVFHAC